jgi:hypothetical protein
MLGVLFLINGFFEQIKSETTKSDQDCLQSSETAEEVNDVRDHSDDDDTKDKMSDNFDPSTNRLARFQVGLSSGESVDSIVNMKDEEPPMSRLSVDTNGDKNKVTSDAASKRRSVTYRKKRHKADKEKCSDDEDDDCRTRLQVTVTPSSSRRQSATQLTLPSYAVIKQDRQFRLRTRKPLEVRSPSNMSCSPVRRNSTCNVPESNGLLRQSEALRNSLRRRSVDIGGKNSVLNETDSPDEGGAAKKVSFSAASAQPVTGTGGLHRTLSTSVLRIKHRRSFWEKVIGYKYNHFIETD